MNMDLYNMIYNEAEIIHIYSYYEIPLTYISQFQEKFYFHHFIQNIDLIDYWFITEITEIEIKRLNDLQLHPRNLLLKQLAFNKLYTMVTNFDNEVISVETYKEKDYQESHFPEQNAVFDYDFLLKKKLEKIELQVDTINQHTFTDKVKKLIVKEFDSLTLSFKDKFNSDLMPLDTLVSISNKISSLYNSYNRGNLAVQAFSKGSFGITLVPIGNSVEEFDLCADEALEKLVKTIEIATLDNEEEQKDYFVNLMKNTDNGKKIVNKLNEFLKDVNKNQYSFTIKDPLLNPLVEYSSSKTQITSLLDELIIDAKQEILIENLEAQLISFNSKTGHVRISFLDDKEVSGYLEENQYKDKKLITPSQIKITLMESIDIENNEKYELKEVSELTYYKLEKS